MAGNLDCRKSTSRYLFTFTGGVISWKSKLQRCVSFFYYKSIVYCSYRSWKRDAMDEEVSSRTGFKKERLHSTL